MQMVLIRSHKQHSSPAAASPNEDRNGYTRMNKITNTITNTIENAKTNTMTNTKTNTIMNTKTNTKTTTKQIQI